MRIDNSNVRREDRSAKRSRHRRWLRLSCLCTAFLTSFAAESRAENANPTTLPTTEPAQVATTGEAQGPRYKKMSLDELMDVEVTTVSRHESTVAQSPAAITVITQDDIHRSGATSIPEALRMAPGLEVAQIDTSTWAISARGFNNNTSNKLLVLMDGRSVYTPLYSGVFWDVQDTMMQDIDRIEVIRGPAGALWGSNAVNGVINIITKDAKDTQGVILSGGGGTEQRDFESTRYGWKVNDNTYARVYAKHFETNETALQNGTGAGDSFFMTQGGFRIDSRPTADDHFTAQGDIYEGNRNNLASADTTLSGGNALGRWTHTLQNGGDVSLQTYYDRTDRALPLLYSEDRDTFDIDFQNNIPLDKRNDVTWGLGYRVTKDRVVNGIIRFVPNGRTEQLFSFFLQDEIQIIPDRVRLTLGSKFEHNDFTGFEVQPSARLLWTIDKRQTAWGAVSRAVRTPTQLEDDLEIVAPGASLIGNKNFESETVLAYELGYRVQPTEWLSLDAATFYNDYDRLSSLEFSNAIFSEQNNLDGQTYGVELGSTWQVADWWKIRGAYTYLQVQFQTDPGSTNNSSIAAEGNDPQNQIYLRSSMDLPHHVSLDFTVRYVGALPNQHVSDYWAADVRLAWQPTEHLEMAVVGKNLFDNQHPEFGTDSALHEIQRGVFGTLTYQW